MRDGHFKWDASMQGVVLSSFYYGYVTTTLVGGILALKFGGKVLLMFAVGWTSALSIITPPLTIVGDAVAMIVVRVLEGVGQVSAMWSSASHGNSCGSHWIPTRMGMY